MSNNFYTMQKSGGYLDKLSLKKRMRMLTLFSREFPSNSFSDVLDVGVTADSKSAAANFFEKYFPVKSKIIALSDQDATFLEEVYPGLTFRQGDAKELPFADTSIDVIFSSAVIEHVGSLENQKKMLAECFRVAKKGVFITTPNRWHPVELHTILPFIHWLPKKIHRAILKKLGLSFYAAEDNLNLLDKKTLTKACKELGIQHFKFKRVKTFGFTSNLILVIHK